MLNAIGTALLNLRNIMQDMGVSVIAYSPLASGKLSAKYLDSNNKDNVSSGHSVSCYPRGHSDYCFAIDTHCTDKQ